MWPGNEAKPETQGVWPGNEAKPEESTEGMRLDLRHRGCGLGMRLG